jgi:hypothetical protein
MRDHWKRFPPVDWLVAAYLGYKPPSTEPQRGDNLGELLAMAGAGGMIEAAG